MQNYIADNIFCSAENALFYSSDLGDAEFGVPGQVKPGPDTNNSF